MYRGNNAVQYYDFSAPPKHSVINNYMSRWKIFRTSVV